jgi:hypothetical protein
MAAPLIDFAREEQRFFIRFLWAEGVKNGEIYGMPNDSSVWI